MEEESRRLADILNRSTPYAPTGRADIDDRMRAAMAHVSIDVENLASCGDDAPERSEIVERSQSRGQPTVVARAGPFSEMASEGPACVAVSDEARLAAEALRAGMKRIELMQSTYAMLAQEHSGGRTTVESELGSVAVDAEGSVVRIELRTAALRSWQVLGGLIAELIALARDQVDRTFEDAIDARLPEVSVPLEAMAAIRTGRESRGFEFIEGDSLELRNMLAEYNDRLRCLADTERRLAEQYIKQEIGTYPSVVQVNCLTGDLDIRLEGPPVSRGDLVRFAAQITEAVRAAETAADAVRGAALEWALTASMDSVAPWQGRR